MLGSIIGWERDRAGKSAGPRTMALVGSASAAGVAVGLGFQIAGIGLTVIILAILRSTQVLEAVPRRGG